MPIRAAAGDAYRRGILAVVKIFTDEITASGNN